MDGSAMALGNKATSETSNQEANIREDAKGKGQKWLTQGKRAVLEDLNKFLVMKLTRTLQKTSCRYLREDQSKQEKFKK